MSEVKLIDVIKALERLQLPAGISDYVLEELMEAAPQGYARATLSSKEASALCREGFVVIWREDIVSGRGFRACEITWAEEAQS